jgi:hypothetical protein
VTYKTISLKKPQKVASIGVLNLEILLMDFETKLAIANRQARAFFATWLLGAIGAIAISPWVLPPVFFLALIRLGNSPSPFGPEDYTE